MTELIDISPPLHAGTAVWPGDSPLSREVLVDFVNGGNLELSTLRTTVHVGAHADAPSHYRAGSVVRRGVHIERASYGSVKGAT